MTVNQFLLSLHFEQPLKTKSISLSALLRLK